MKGDFSRQTFDKDKHYTTVALQQGRVLLDADWNEQQAILDYYRTTEAADIIGKCGAPENQAGFAITYDGTHNDLRISPGRYYVDGILCENDAEVLYKEQPDLPHPLDIEQNPSKPLLVYLDVWQRLLTVLDDPSICEQALGGPDTAVRIKTVWQVKILPVTPDGNLGMCQQKFPEWDDLLKDFNGKLKARTAPAGNTNAGYQRLENQLYRVEIHDGGDSCQGGVTFKWSRDNGSVVTSIARVKEGGTEVTVNSLGPDDELGFAIGQNVELSDDTLELNGQPGQLAVIKDIVRAQRKVTLDHPLKALDGRDPKMRRWDGICTVPSEPDCWVRLEDGIEVQFCPGNYKTGDYWLIPARAASGKIEWPETQDGPLAQSPLGIHHHYCRLALVTKPRDGTASTGLEVRCDYRTIFRPLVDAPRAEAFLQAGTDNKSVQEVKTFFVGIDTRSVKVDRENGQIASMAIKDPSDGSTVVGITVIRENGQISQIQKTVGVRVITIKVNHTNGQVTSITKAVS